jgi:N-acetyl-anhydromuramyl-L-alanine amidase AmpD
VFSGGKKMANLVGGLLVDSRITPELRPKIEHGALDLNKVVAIVLHQTYSSTANSTLNSWKTKETGAHFLIDRGGAEYKDKETGRVKQTVDGKIYQTARLDRVCWHVGIIRARCMATLQCVAPKGQKPTKEQQIKGLETLSRHEHKKAYPSRYPTNNDSIGIEIVTMYDEKNGAYPKPTRAQAEAVIWLIEAIVEHIPGISSADIYEHGKISPKDPGLSEGTGVWDASGRPGSPFSNINFHFFQNFSNKRPIP